MLSLVAVEVYLMPDWSIIIQLGIFLCVIALLNFLVFKPVLAILDRRRTSTTEARAEAEHLDAETKRMDDERAQKISEAAAKAGSERSAMLARRRTEADATIKAAHDDAKEMIDSTELSVESSEEKAEERIETEAKQLSEDIISRIAGPAARESGGDA